MKIRLLTIALVVLAITAFCPINANADNNPIAGDTYDNVSWQITEDNILLIGNPDSVQTMIADNNRTHEVFPWYDYAGTIKGVEFVGKVNLQGSLRGMFAYQNAVEYYAGLDNVNTSNVTNMRGMFYGNSSITSLDLSSFDTGNVEDLAGMFNACSSITSLDLRNFNTENTTVMLNMFKDCSSLKSVDVSKFNTENVISVLSMFENCTSLTEIDLSNFDLRNVQYTSSIFLNCANLKRISFGPYFRASSNAGSFPLFSKDKKRMFYNANRDYMKRGGTFNQEETDLGYYEGSWVVGGVVTFDANGGEGNMPDQTFYYGEEPKALTTNAFTKGIDDFLGWANEDGDILFQDGEEISYSALEEKGLSYDAITLHAAWRTGTPDTYTGKTAADVHYTATGFSDTTMNINMAITLTGIYEDSTIKAADFKNAFAPIVTVTGKSQHTYYVGMPDPDLNGKCSITSVTITSPGASLHESNGGYITDELSNEITTSTTLKIQLAHTCDLETIIDNQPTCNENGQSHGVCRVCGHVTGSHSIPAAHDWDADYSIDEYPTCTKDGKKSIHCKKCDAKKDEESIPAAHDWDTDYSIDEYPTCTKDGKKSIHCKKCSARKDETVIPAGHDWEAAFTIDRYPTCTVNGIKSIHCKKCNVVKEETIIPAAHDWSDTYTVDRKADCETSGRKSIHCNVCDAIKDGTTVIIPAMGHSTPLEHIPAKAATYNKEGSVECWHCTRCNKYFSDADAKHPIEGNGWIIKALTPPNSTELKEIVDLPAVKISKPKAGKKSMTVKWKKPKKKVLKKIQGYEIQYSMDGFKTIVGTRYAGKGKKSVKIKGLQPKIKYQVRIRAYKNASDGKHVSGWKTKTVMVK